MVNSTALPTSRTMLLVALAMLAFAGNSLLCRVALGHTRIDATSFTSIRLLSGAAVLWLLTRHRRDDRRGKAARLGGSWGSALALLAYALAFSLAYARLTAATGALVLFGAVQLTMIGVGVGRGERLQRLQAAGLAVALVGLVALLLPGLSAPPLASALLMAIAGVAWGIYSLRGAGPRDAAGHDAARPDPLGATAGNFLRTVPMALLASLAASAWLMPDLRGSLYAVASGAVTSGIGYAIWYAALPRLGAVRASVVQLSVPVIAAVGGVALLDESMSLRLTMCSLAILGGVALVIAGRGARRIRQ